ncbi:MAG: GNAT family N-acetyltransferase [Candidatus Eisenbacteria bacterium]|nr:GNAT family N-acetyltransferase [Candidatus Eisenbacteria bacterium]
MTRPSIHLATPNDFRAIARFIEEHNQIPAAQCIQINIGESEESLLVELEKLHEAGEITFMLSLEKERVTGVMGCNFVESEGRGWLRGPLITTPARTDSSSDDNFTTSLSIWPSLAGELYNTLMPAIPATIRVVDAFLNVENTRGQAFYEAQGFWVRGQHHVYVAKRPDPARTPPIVCPPMQSDQGEAVAALHNTVFPNTRTGHGLLSELDDDHRVWVHALDGEVQGYVFAGIEPWTDCGYVEFLGVREDARGRRVGGALLATALEWCFTERGMPEMGLTVEDGNVNARGLYEQSGFQLKYSGVNQRWERK